MAKDDLTGNLATEDLERYFEMNGISLNLDAKLPVRSSFAIGQPPKPWIATSNRWQPLFLSCAVKF